MFVLVCYDIADDRVRDQVADILKNYGVRVQYSVFECELDSKAFEEMRRELAVLHIGRGDGIRCYFLCEGCSGKTLMIRDSARLRGA